jgi:hypothetical protein
VGHRRPGGLARRYDCRVRSEQSGPNAFWLNEPEHLNVRIPLDCDQTRTFTYGFACDLDLRHYYNMNFFFNRSEESVEGGIAGISVLAEQSDVPPESGGPFPPFTSNASTTVGWPGGPTPGAGTLVYEDIEFNLRVELVDFKIYQVTALGDGAGVDLGNDGSFIDGPGGRADILGEYTLEISTLNGRPCGEEGPIFRRGDHDGSGTVDITDSLNRPGFLFLGTTPSDCLDASDFDNSGVVDITDSLNELAFLFLGAIIPPPPGIEDCGPDPREVIPAGGGLPEQADIELGCEEAFCL